MRSPLRESLFSAFLENIPLKLLSLGFAVALWGWVQSEQVIERRVRARILYDWPDVGELVRVGEVPTRLIVTTTGPQGLVRTIEPQQLWVEVDMSEGVVGKNPVDFSTARIHGLPDNLTVSQISPPEAVISMERPVDRLVRIDPITVGNPAPGWELVSLTADPETVRIIGPQTQILSTDKLPTEFIDIEDLREDRVVEVPLVTGSSIRADLDPPRVRVTIDVEQAIEKRTFNDVPVMVRGDGWESDVHEVTVVLEGPVNDIQLVEASRLSIVAHLPSPPPGVTPYPLRFDPDDPAAGLEVVNKGSPDITVIEVRPATINLLERLPE